jgi:hypothetical protein
MQVTFPAPSVQPTLWHRSDLGQGGHHQNLPTGFNPCSDQILNLEMLFEHQTRSLKRLYHSLISIFGDPRVQIYLRYTVQQ